eukprot:m.1013702 g.1013702  ORF g.1013702 m.1013702 type:complete len:554 (+) comp24068_c0_seq12:99-1760(+)
MLLTMRNSILLLGVLLYVAEIASTHTSQAGGNASVQLFMTLDDVVDPYGLLQPQPGSVVRNSSFVLPRGINYATGAMVLAVLPSLQDISVWEVYVGNTTGWEPLQSNSGSAADFVPQPPPPKPDDICGPSGATECSLEILRYTTTDFISYSGAQVVLRMPDKPFPGMQFPLPTLKSIARNDATGEYVLFTYGMKQTSSAPARWRGASIWTSTDRGLTWAQNLNVTLPPPIKDDLNIIFNRDQNGTPAFVDMQIYDEKNTTPNEFGKYEDNGGYSRRVLTAKISYDGVTWGPDLDVRTPDALDPPDLQFYRFRPFYIGHTGRLAGHALLYSPAPWIGLNYGRQPRHCKTDVSQCTLGSSCGRCHGPHLYEELWIGPRNGSAWSTLSWQRPFRAHRFVPSSVPHDAFLMAQPATVEDQGAHIFLDATGVYTVPLLRFSGIYSPSNGEFSTQPLTLGARGLQGLWINAAAGWRGRLVTGGCDEGCSAYIFAEVYDAATMTLVPGYTKETFNVLENVDGFAIPMVWKAVAAAQRTAPSPVVVRVYFRDATIYAVGAS